MTVMRRSSLILLVVLAALVAATAVALRVEAAPEASAALDEGGVSAFMPMLARRARFDDLATPVIATPAPTKTDTPQPSPTQEPSPTIHVPPTNTPLPSVTPTAAVAGVIRGRLTRNGEPLDPGLGDGFGPGLFLQRCSVADEGADEVCDVVGRTGVVDDGRYEFRVPEPLAEGEYYQMVWRNEDGTFGDYETIGAPLWLGAWYGPRIETFEAGDEVEIPEIELANMQLLGPSHGTGYQGWPWLFTWERWAGDGGSYRWGIGDCCSNLDQRKDVYRANAGKKPEYLLQGLPPGLTYNEKYCWFAEVDAGEERGYGQSFHVWMLWFIPSLVDNFEASSPGEWLRPSR
jgi:hypothetical protein